MCWLGLFVLGFKGTWLFGTAKNNSCPTLIRNYLPGQFANFSTGFSTVSLSVKKELK